MCRARPAAPARLAPAIVTAFACAVLVPPQAFGQSFDSKPPAVADLPPAPPAPAQKNPDATFRAAPKPLAKGAVTADWPAFLGPNHNLVVPETKILDRFPEGGPRVVWEATKGSGYAAPAVVGDRLVLFHRLGDRETVDCLKADTGERYWRFDYPTAFADRYGYNDGPRASPVVATATPAGEPLPGGPLVYAMGAEGKLHCLELATGRLRWARDLKADFKLRPQFFGLGSTPLVDGDVLIVNVGAVPAGPCVAGFDLLTGRMKWGAGDAWGMSYAAPVPATVHGKRRVFVFAGGETEFGEKVTGGLLCVDPTNGKLDFAFPWRGRPRESVNASTPLVVGNRVFISECYRSGGALVEVTPDFKAKEVWRNAEFGTHFMTAVHLDGHLYGVDGHGPHDAFLACVNADTGQEVWRTQPEWKEPVGDRRLTMGTYRAHVLRVDGKTLVLGEYGHLLWADLSPKGFVERQRATLFLAEQTWTPPVLSRGLLYVCQTSPDVRTRAGPRVICYDLRGE